jgi:hypothetical protein
MCVVTIGIIVRADTPTEAGALALLSLARKHPDHWEKARLLTCEPERFLPAGPSVLHPEQSKAQGWSVRFVLPTMTMAEALEVGERR